MYLVSVETVKIKDFIFNTNKLKTIRGASFLLDYLNQVVVKSILEKNKVKDDDILYVAAGNAKFYCENENTAKKIEKEIKEEYRIFAPDSKLAISMIDTSKNGNEKIWDAMDNLANETNIIKNKGFSKINLDIPFIEKCNICCDSPAQIKKENYNEALDKYVDNFKRYPDVLDTSFENLKTLKDRNKIKEQIFMKDSDKNIGLCPSCFAKYISANLIKEDFKGIGFYSKFNETFKEEFKPIDSLEEYKLKKSFIGFMYADGDSVGEYLKNIKSKFEKDKENGEKNYKKELQEFSRKLDTNTKNSLIEVLKEMRAENKIDEHFGEFLIVGGDDVCAIFPGHLVMEISKRFQEKFNDKMRLFSGITSSSGVIIAKMKTPLHYLFDQSLTLQKNAKKKRYEIYKDKNEEFKNGFIDFQVIGSEGTVNIDEFRKGVKSLIERPYSIEDLNNTSFQDLIHMIKKLKSVNFPKNKLRFYYDLKVEIEKNPNKSMENLFEIINTILKLDKDQKEILLNWIGRDTLTNSTEDSLKEVLKNIFDVLELYDFV